VAQLAGFEHPEYMSRLFKGKMGITPGEYRKQAGGLPQR
jgi:AraC-like DNA-binding protein